MMTLVGKRKRSDRATDPHWQIWVSQGFALLAMVYTASAFVGFAPLFELCMVIAGMALTFLWPWVVFSLFLGLQWQYSRTHGQPIRAESAAYLLVGMGVMTVGVGYIIVSHFVI